MQRGFVIALSVMGVFLVVLAVSFALVGSDLDRVRLEREGLQFELDDLQQQFDRVSGERDRLQRQTEDQLKAIEQWKAQLEHSRSSQPASISVGGGQEVSQPTSAPAP